MLYESVFSDTKRAIENQGTLGPLRRAQTPGISSISEAVVCLFLEGPAGLPAWGVFFPLSSLSSQTPCTSSHNNSHVTTHTHPCLLSSLPSSVPWLLLSLVSSIQRQHSDHSNHTASPLVRPQAPRCRAELEPNGKNWLEEYVRKAWEREEGGHNPC